MTSDERSEASLGQRANFELIRLSLQHSTIAISLPAAATKSIPALVLWQMALCSASELRSPHALSLLPAPARLIEAS